MIDYNVNPCGWFRVMQHTSDLHNHCANQSNEYNLLPLTLAKGEFGDITLLTEFHFNEYILYQEYDYKYTEEGGNESLGKWYGRAPNRGVKMCNWIITKGNELVFQINIRSARGYQLNATYVDELETHQLKGRSKNYPIVHDLNELAYQGYHHQAQVFNPH